MLAYHTSSESSFGAAWDALPQPEERLRVTVPDVMLHSPFIFSKGKSGLPEAGANL
jgi:hypothetical protein